MRGFAIIGALLLIMTPCFASVFKADKNLVISQPVSQNAYLAGNIVTVNSDVNGDLLIGANMVEVSGDVNGDVMAGANSIIINGNVDGDVRCGGNSVIINGNVTGEVLAGAAQVVINSVIGELTVGAGKVLINGEVLGNATVNAENITLAAGASIGGFLNYTSNNEALLAESQVGDFIQHNEPGEIEMSPWGLMNTWAARLIWSLVGLAGTLITGFVLTRLSDRKVVEFQKSFGKDSFAKGAKGFAVLVLVPIAVVIGLVTVVAAPISLVVIGLYAIGLYLAWVLSAFYIGLKTLDLFRVRKQSLIIELLVGALTLKLISWVPFAGGFINFLIMLVGFGALLGLCRSSFEECKKKKIC